MSAPPRESGPRGAQSRLAAGVWSQVLRWGAPLLAVAAVMVGAAAAQEPQELQRPAEIQERQQPEADAPALVAALPPFPIDERLRYKVSWLGIHCGAMTLTSFAEQDDGGTTYRIVMTARSSEFFDGVYRVRSRIESWYSGRLMSSVRYHDVSHEKKKVRDDLFEFDHAAGEVLRTKNGEQQRLGLDVEQVNDPLAFLYRLRLLATGSDDQMSLVLATTKGPLATVARIVERRQIETPFGRREALLVVPSPEDGMLFSKAGQMSLWLGADDWGTPYRIEFDLSFGTLVAKLVQIERPATASQEIAGDIAWSRPRSLSVEPVASGLRRSDH